MENNTNTRQKRNSILKVRQEVNLIDETTVVTAPNANRRVSFHQVKHVKEYDRDHGKIIDATPVKEKAFDTMSSDGASTAHTTRVDMDVTGESQMASHVFESAPVTPGPLEMSLENQNLDETARLFDVTREKTLVYTETTKTKTTVTRITTTTEAAADDTMALFNMTNRDGVDMSIANHDDTINVFNTTNTDRIDMDITQQKGPLDDTMALFRSPMPPPPPPPSSRILQNPLVENSESIDMDITTPQMAVVKDSEDMDITEAQNPEVEEEEEEPGSEAMDITVASAAARGGSAASDDTMSVFLATPKKIQMTSEIQKNHEDMEMTLKNETLDLFQSPAVAAVARGGKTMLQEQEVDMDITQREGGEPSDNTISVFRSPEKIPTRPVFNDNDSMDISSTFRPESEVAVEENRCVSTVLQMSAMEMASPEVSIQNSLPTTTSSATSHSSSINNSSVTLNVSKNDGDAGASERSQHATMMMDVTNPVLEEDSEDVTMTKEDSRRSLNVSSVSRRRRSLLMDSARESPRRLALENSMLSMTAVVGGGAGGGGGSEALAEYRQNKTMLNDSVASGGNQTFGNVTATGRDIFKMNTSIRSPAHHRPTTTIVTSPESIPPPKSPESFRLPQFDAAIVNVIYLTPEDVTQEPIPEAFEFQKLLAQHEADAHRDIEKSVAGDESLQKMLDELSEDVVKMRGGHLERDVIGIARGLAEQRFLEIREGFAEEQVAKSEAKIVELEAENARIAQRIQDARNVDLLRAEIHELQRQPTREEASRIRREHHEVKMEALRMQVASIRSRYDAELKLREQQKRMQDAMEEQRERIARLEEQEAMRKEEMVKRVRAIVPGVL